MTFNGRLRNLAYGAAVIGALSGCATVQRGDPAPRPRAAAEAPAQPARELTPTERCQRERRTRVQDCIIESIATTCREGNQGNDEGFYSCISDNLVQNTAERAPRQASLVVSYGDEVLSTRVGGPAMIATARLEVAQVDERGVALLYEIERVEPAAYAERTRMNQVTVRYNFDGSSEGNTFMLDDLPIWNFRVSANGDGRARVSFETADPRILVRPADAEQPAQKKK